MNIISNNPELDFVPVLRDNMDKHNFMLSYRGMISQETVKTLLALTEKKLEVENTETAVKKKIFNVMLDCLQNICKVDKDKVEYNSTIFMIGKSNDSYVVYSGKVIENSKADDMKKLIDEINQLNKEQLKELFLKQIKDESKNLSQTDLGLIDMAKKSGQRLIYDITDLNSKKSFFSLQSTILIN